MTQFIRNETLFNSVEKELGRRWACHNVPSVFVNRPILHLRLTVKAWWNLYHESACARRRQNWIIWERNPVYPTTCLETQQLVFRLVDITHLFDFNAILDYCSLSQREESSIGLLTLLTAYYSSPQSELWMQIL